MVLTGRTLRSTPDSGHRASYDGQQRKKGSKVHIAVDTLGNLPAVHITRGKEQKRAPVAMLAVEVQVVTGGEVEPAYRRYGLYGRGRRHGDGRAGHAGRGGPPTGGEEGFVR